MIAAGYDRYNGGTEYADGHLLAEDPGVRLVRRCRSLSWTQRWSMGVRGRPSPGQASLGVIGGVAAMKCAKGWRDCVCFSPVRGGGS